MLTKKHTQSIPHSDEDLNNNYTNQKNQFKPFDSKRGDHIDAKNAIKNTKSTQNKSIHHNKIDEKLEQQHDFPLNNNPHTPKKTSPKNKPNITPPASNGMFDAVLLMYKLASQNQVHKSKKQ